MNEQELTIQEWARLQFARWMVETGKYSDQCELTPSEAEWELPKPRHEVWTASGLVMMDE